MTQPKIPLNTKQKKLQTSDRSTAKKKKKMWGRPLTLHETFGLNQPQVNKVVLPLITFTGSLEGPLAGLDLQSL